MPADLVLILNLSQSIPSLRLVRSATELLTKGFPPLAAGATLTCELRLIDGNGDPFADYLDDDNSPRFLMWIPGPTGGVQLALVSGSAFTALDDEGEPAAMPGWGFTLPLTSQAILNYLAGWTDARPVNIEISLNISGAMKPLFMRQATLLPRLGAASDSTVTTQQGQEFRADITDAAQHKALATLGHVLPWVMATMEDGQWNTWTLRARTGADPSDATIASDDPNGLSWRVPTDGHPVSNNVIWVKSAIV